MATGSGASPFWTVILVVVALIVGAAGMYWYNENNKEAVSLELPGGEITIEREN